MIWVTFNNIEKSRLGSLSLETRWGKLGDVLPFWRRNMPWPKKNVLYSRPLEIFIDFYRHVLFFPIRHASCKLTRWIFTTVDASPLIQRKCLDELIPSFVLCVSGVVDSLPPGWWNMYPIYPPFFCKIYCWSDSSCNYQSVFLILNFQFPLFWGKPKTTAPRYPIVSQSYWQESSRKSFFVCIFWISLRLKSCLLAKSLKPYNNYLLCNGYIALFTHPMVVS